MNTSDTPLICTIPMLAKAMRVPIQLTRDSGMGNAPMTIKLIRNHLFVTKDIESFIV